MGAGVMTLLMVYGLITKQLLLNGTDSFIFGFCLPLFSKPVPSGHVLTPALVCKRPIYYWATLATANVFSCTYWATLATANVFSCTYAHLLLKALGHYIRANCYCI